MSDKLPHSRDADDAHSDDAPPTDALSDEVKTDAAESEDHTSVEADDE